MASSSESGTQKSVEIDPRPSEDENIKKSTPQMEFDHQEIEEVPLIEGTEKTIRIGRDLNPQIRLHLIQVLRQKNEVCGIFIRVWDSKISRNISQTF